MKEKFNIPAGKFAGVDYPRYSQEPYVSPRERNGFVSFWLWLGLIGSILSVASSFVNVSVLTNLGDYGVNLLLSGMDLSQVSVMFEKASTILYASSIISAVCGITGYIMLLKWNKRGFWVLVISTIILSCLSLYAIGIVYEAYSIIDINIDIITVTAVQVVSSLLSLVVLWAILQIKKNGVSCWSMLE